MSLVKGQVSLPGVIRFFTICSESENCSRATANLNDRQRAARLEKEKKFWDGAAQTGSFTRTCSLWRTPGRWRSKPDTETSSSHMIWSSPEVFVPLKVPAFEKQPDMKRVPIKNKTTFNYFRKLKPIFIWIWHFKTWTLHNKCQITYLRLADFCQSRRSTKQQQQ